LTPEFAGNVWRVLESAGGPINWTPPLAKKLAQRLNQQGGSGSGRASEGPQSILYRAEPPA